MSRDINLYFSFGLEAFEFLFSNRHVLILGVLESTNEFIALNELDHYGAHTSPENVLLEAILRTLHER